jgi:4-amino-4-deoxy-L-arabinose transferase-like glycosyltransferase
VQAKIQKSVLTRVFVPVILCIFTVGLRLWFSGLVPQPLGWDQMEYRYFAVDMLRQFFHVTSARLYGYPLFISLLYRIFGLEDYLAYFTAQAVLEGLTVLLVYYLAKLIKPSLAFWAALIYALNPFTAAYTRVLLAEIPSAFIFTGGLVLLILASGRRLNWFWAWSGLAFGLLCQFKPALGVTGVGLPLIFLYGAAGRLRDQAVKILVFAAAFGVPFVYNLIGNLMTFKTLAPLTVDNLFVREFYNSVYVENQNRPMLENPVVYPQEVVAIIVNIPWLPRHR